MKKVGFLISKKENERRRALILSDIKKIQNKDCLYFETGYGKELGFSDEELLNLGCHIINEDEIDICDIIVEPKIGDSEILDKIQNKIVFGWIHATQNYDITQKFIDNKLTGYAWEKMFYKNVHTFYKNNYIAGEAAIIHAMTLYGKKFSSLKVAVLGRGNTAFGAIDMLNKLGADVTIYSSKSEQKFKEDLGIYDVIVNCILWDVNRKDHIIYISDLKHMKKGSLIIDVSCDRNGGIESSIPTTIDDPIYIKEGVMHYVVDHTPTLLFKDATKSISNAVVEYIDYLINDEYNEVLNNSLIIKDGIIIDKEINKYQSR